MGYHRRNVFKAASVGVAINTLLALVTLWMESADLGEDAWFTLYMLILFGAFALVPIGVGALYGYCTRGAEGTGGLPSGSIASGIVVYVASGVVFAVMFAVEIWIFEGFAGEALLTSGATIVGASCGAVTVGALFGLVGGAIWGTVQKVRD